MFNRALALLRSVLGPQADFRRNQWEAIEALVVHRRRVLVVERAGWGKRLISVLAAKLRRECGAGPTLTVSPMLSLMRRQLLMARRVGLRAAGIHAGNTNAWVAIERALANDACDLLVIPPERLHHERFLQNVLPLLQQRTGLLIVDEAHNLSDWGHDFRPDCRRLGPLRQRLPRDIPVLATTATANHRVVRDIAQQLGEEMLVIRGAMARSTLRLQNLVMPAPAVRLAWLAENLPKFAGSGVIYCLTVADAQRVAGWLRSRGTAVRAYHGGLRQAQREMLERALIDNELKALAATAALGSGFDKPDLSFVIHFQRPGSLAAFYQQVGRAGREGNRAYGILLAGEEDGPINRCFIDGNRPRADVARRVLEVLSRHEGMTETEIGAATNIGHAPLESALRMLEIDGAIAVKNAAGRNRYRGTGKSWKPDLERVREIAVLRRMEWRQIQEYVQHRGCLMEFLARDLDDPEARPCGVCANCQGAGFRAEATPSLIAEADAFLRNGKQASERSIGLL